MAGTVVVAFRLTRSSCHLATVSRLVLSIFTVCNVVQCSPSYHTIYRLKFEPLCNTKSFSYSKLALMGGQLYHHVPIEHIFDFVFTSILVTDKQNGYALLPASYYLSSRHVMNQMFVSFSEYVFWPFPSA